MYRCTVKPPPSRSSPPKYPGARPTPDILASVTEESGLMLSHCMPGLCPSLCDAHPSSAFGIELIWWVYVSIPYHDGTTEFWVSPSSYTRIEYVKIPSRHDSDFFECQEPYGSRVGRGDKRYEHITCAHEFESIPCQSSPKFDRRHLFFNECP